MEVYKEIARRCGTDVSNDDNIDDFFEGLHGIPFALMNKIGCITLDGATVPFDELPFDELEEMWKSYHSTDLAVTEVGGV